MSEGDPLAAAIRRAQLGDAEAFAPIVEAYAPLLRAWCAAHAPSWVDSDEVAQVTLINTYRALPRFAVGSDFAAWLLTIARNVLRGELRRTRRARRVPLDDLAQAEMAAPDGDPTLVDRLRRCLERLPGGVRGLLDAYYGEGRSLADLARASADSISALKSRLHQVRRRLADCVGRAAGGEA